MNDYVMFRDSYYRVYRDGRVYSEKTKRFIKQSVRNGYRFVELRLHKRAKKTGVHRVVAECYHPNPNNFPLVCHLNDVRDDNRAENLMWGDKRTNWIHALENGRVKNISKGLQNVYYSDDQVFAVKSMYKTMSARQISEKLGIPYKSVCFMTRADTRPHVEREVYKDAPREYRRELIVTHDGETRTLADWCRKLGVNHGTVKARVQRGTDPWEALTRPLKPGNFRKGKRLYFTMPSTND